MSVDDLEPGVPSSSELRSNRFSLRQLMLVVTAICAFLGIAVALGSGVALHVVVLVAVYQAIKSTWVPGRLFLAIVCFVACAHVSGTRYISHREHTGFVAAMSMPLEIECELFA